MIYYLLSQNMCLILDINPAFVGGPEEYHKKPLIIAGPQVQICTWNLLHAKYECCPLSHNG
jgi:hypothetical protein